MVGEEPGEHGAYAVGGERDAVLVCDAGYSAGDRFCGLFEGVVDVFLVIDEVAEGGDAGGHGEWVSAEGSGLVDRAERREVLHDVGASAEGSAGESAADDLAEGGEVGGDVVELLGPAEGDAEAGHDLVEEEESAVGCGDFAKAFEVARVRRDGAGVSDDGFDDDAGDVVWTGGEDCGDGVEVVEGQGEGVHGSLGGDACGAGDPESGDSAAGLDEHRVGVAVVAALELDDEVAAGESAGEADGGHAGFGAGGDEAELLDGGKAVGDEFREIGFGGDGGSEAGALGGGLLDGFDDGRKGMAKDHRPPGAEEVEVAVAIFVVEVCAFGVGEEGWVSAYGAEGADGRVDASWEEFFSTLLQVTRTGEATSHAFSIGGRRF